MIDPSVRDIQAYLHETGQSIVVFSILRHHKSIFGEWWRYPQPRFDYKPSASTPSPRHEDFRTAQNSIVVGLISGGNWSLSRVDHYIGSHYPIRPWDILSGEPNAYGFTVSAGEVIYLGHVEIDVTPPPRTALTFSMYSRIDDAKRALAEIIPEHAKLLETLLEERHATVVPRY